MPFLRYLWACTLASGASAALLLPAFGIFVDPNQLVSTWLFVAAVHFLFIGTIGWVLIVVIRFFGVLTALPVMGLAAGVASVGWAGLGGLLFARDGGPQIGAGAWAALGGIAGLAAGYIVKRLGFPDFMHREQFLQERRRGTYTYKAFLSYSRADEQQAVRIWRELDAYRVPKELVGRPGTFGALPHKLYPIFRDREELSSGEALNTVLVDALKASERLIVLMSPASAKSTWVNLEIETFAAAHGVERIFPVVLSGIPDPDAGDQSCVPPALRQLNILAADLRRLEAPDGTILGDGPKIGMTKLIAGLLGVDLEHLQRRESAREARRHGAAVAYAAFATTATILSLALFAVAANFVAWMLSTLETEISAEATRLVELHAAEGPDALEQVLRLQKSGAGLCRALVEPSGQVRYGDLPAAVGREVAPLADGTTFSIRYRERLREYAGSPFPKRIDGVTRRLDDGSQVVVALCNFAPPYFFGSFRSIFDPRTIDTIIEAR